MPPFCHLDMIIIRTIKACCDTEVCVAEADKPLRKHQVQVFRDAGYSLPEQYLKIGVVYLEKKGLVVTGSYGQSRLHIRASKPELIEEFKKLLEQAINS